MCKSYKVIFINVNTPILILIAQETKLFNLPIYFKEFSNRLFVR